MADMFDPLPVANGLWSFQKIFNEGTFIAAGQLLIPPKGLKPSKPATDNTYVREPSLVLAACPPKTDFLGHGRGSEAPRV